MIKLSPLGLSVLLTGVSSAAIVWEVGSDNGTQDGNGDATLNEVSQYNGLSLPGSGVQEIGTNTLPGNPANTGGSGATRSVDDDFYFEGVYPAPIGTVASREQYWERAITNGDPNLRWHFNVPASVLPTDTLTFSIDFFNLSESSVVAGSGYDLEFFVDGNQIGGVQTHDVTTTTTAQTWDFTLADLGGTAEQGAGFNHYVEIRSTSQGNAQWASLDYVRLENTPVPEVSSSLYLLGLAGFGFYRRRK